MPNATITQLSEELNALAKVDAEAIEALALEAADKIAAILEKYSEVPAELGLPMLSAGRNCVSTLRMQFPKAPPGMAIPVATMPMP